MNFSNKFANMKWLIILVVVIHHYHCVEVHFESADSGFFLKHSRQAPVSPEISNIYSSPLPPTRPRTTYDSVLSVDRFTIAQTTQPVSIRASYGPFSTKQTVPARYIVPDAKENQGEYLNNTTAALIELQQSNMHLDISAHLVRASIPQDSPVLRVLFHTGADPSGHLQRQNICVLLHVSIVNQMPLKGRCMPEGEDGVCVAEVVIPFNWWPPIPLPTRSNRGDTPIKVPQRLVQVSYSVFEPPLRNPEQCEPKVQIQPLTIFAQVPLVPATTAFKELRADESLTVLIPQNPLYPMSKIHVPVFLHQSNGPEIAAFTMKARVKSGIKLLGATVSSDSWNISIEKENSKHTTAYVTAFQKEPKVNAGQKHESEWNGAKNNTIEIFSWLLEVSHDMKETLDGSKIIWSTTYIFDYHKDTSETILTDETKKRLITKLEVNKDDIQAVLPMAKNWELMNTAVLTGRQVAQAMKVFIVSQAGKVADVTLQSSCHAEDESVIKVSSSCSSVYVDGSEIRGSSNASVIVKYGTYVGLAKFTVWMPEFPLEVYISDFRLSQIKGWKILDESYYMHNKQTRRRKKRSYIWGHHSSNIHDTVGSDKITCRARFQQSPVEVYAKFLAVDQNSGRISYFISRKTGLRVTDLVQPLLRIADPKIASLKGRILQGKSMGRTDVQVLSPITGRVIGAKEIRVGSDKVSLLRLIVRVVSGLQLTIIPDNSVENGYIAETSVTHKLTAQYQEGLLDIDLEFSDGSKTPLRDISVEDYFLLVESLDTEVVAFAPMLASHHPRVIAVGEGNGNLLRVTLLLSEDCRTRRNALLSKQIKPNVPPLANALASVEVDFNNIDNAKHESVQNDGIGVRERKIVRNNGDLADIIVGIPLKDSTHSHEPTVQARQYRGNIYSVNKHYSNKKTLHDNMTSMEVGMYVLLTAFCFAILVFVISCVVYASKFKPTTMEMGLDNLDLPKDNFNTSIILREPRTQKEATTNVHDWVWLGRSTMDRSSLYESAVENEPDSRIRITSNPIINYANDNKASKCVTTFNINGNPENLSNINIIPNTTKKEGNMYSTDYRPPVPPHRNIANETLGKTFQSPQIFRNNLPNSRHGDNYQQHKLNETICPNHDHITQEIQQMLDFKLLFIDHQSTENNTKESVCQPHPKQVVSSHEIRRHNKALNNEMHNAEKLVESTDRYKNNAFQFDSLTPRKIPMVFEKLPKNEVGCNEPQTENINHINDSNSSTKREFLSSHHGPVISKKSVVKRVAVVGNPMFSNAEDSNIGSDGNLGLDNLDMNYEEIMHYFDNLKESNA